MVGYNEKTIDFPFYGYGLKETPIQEIVYNHREFTVLRYKGINDEIRDKMNKLIDEKYLYMNYSLLTFPELNLNTTYCSHFIYHLYKDAIGASIITDPGNFIYPMDFINNTKYFYELDF